MSERTRRKGTKDAVFSFHGDSTKMKSVHQISGFFFILGIFYILSCVLISRSIIDSEPELKDSEIPFIGTEAWRDLKELNDIGPKVSGTHANEVIAANMVKSKIEKIINKANKLQNVEFDHQIVSGSYYLGFKPKGSATIYRSVQNLVARIYGKSNETRNAILLNCHFDSVMGSYGANDDLANCAIMLEILSILSKSDSRLQHDVIFLFNGAEEIGLRASHGFITKHKWARDVKVVINLEAAGSGGKEILFQTGPGNSWLLNHYQAVKRPFAQVSSEEIFQSGLIPSDTDFRIFRDYGNVVGLDFAHVAKGYRYHTKYDHFRFLSKAFIQRTGENVLALTISLANGNELSNFDAISSKDDFAVYFDYLGIIFVHYTKEIGAIINFIIAVLSIALPFLSLNKATASIHSKHIMKETILGLISTAVGAGLSILVCYLLGYFLDKAGHSMTWYRNTFLALGIYGSTTLLSLILTNDIIDTTLASKNSPISLGLKVQARLNGVSFFWAILTLGITTLGFRSGYLFMVVLFINLMVNIFIYFVRFQNAVRCWLYVYLFGQFFILIWTSYFLNIVADVFIPIMGRSGSQKNPEAFLSVIVSATTFFITSYFIPLTLLLRGKVVQYLTVISLLLVSIFLATSTYYGFPYQDDSTGNPTPQRHHVLHTTRNFYDIDRNLRHSDNGFLFLEWDRNAWKTIEGVTMNSPGTLQTLPEMCNDEVLCGLPCIQSRMLVLGFQWLPTKTKPKVRDDAVIDSHNKFSVGENLVKFVFTVNSTSLASIYIHPRGDNEMVHWSFSNTFEDVSNKTYLCSIANGVPEKIEPLKFDVTLKVKKNQQEKALIDVTLVTIQIDEADFSKTFRDLLRNFPPWAFPVPVLSSVNAYTF